MRPPSTPIACDDAEVETPGEAPPKFDERFEIRANTRTIFTADVTPVGRGRSGSYVLQPVADGVEVADGE